MVLIKNRGAKRSPVLIHKPESVKLKQVKMQKDR